MNNVVFLILMLTSVYGQAQYQLSISNTDLSKKKKSIEFMEGSRIDISYFKSLDMKDYSYLRKNISVVNGKVKKITTDTVSVKKFLSKKTFNIPVKSIFQIRKPTHLAVISSIATGAYIGGYFVSESIGYFLPAPIQWSIPALVYLYVDQKILNPMKTVNEEFYQRKNAWLMTIEQVKK